MGLVLGGGPAAFRALHDGVALDRAEVPPAPPAAFPHADLKKGELLRHRIVGLYFKALVPSDVPFRAVTNVGIETVLVDKRSMIVHRRSARKADRRLDPGEATATICVTTSLGCKKSR